jgi:phenylalanine-4-hydroxylase
MDTSPGSAPTQGEADIVPLDQDHPGFRDAEYRARRNAIAKLALDWRWGQPVPRVGYTDVENGVWTTAVEKLVPLHHELACREYLQYWPALAFPTDRIPELADVNVLLSRISGFNLVPVAGLVTPRVFMSRLADGVFLSTQYMRHHSVPLYTPEPDIIHELIGHAALLAAPEFARMNRLFGEASKRADEPAMKALLNVYWYVMEFGLVREEGQLRIIGSGLLSSFGEMGHVKAEAEKVPFDLARVSATGYDPTVYQRTLFVGEQGTAALFTQLTQWLDGIIQRGGTLA